MDELTINRTAWSNEDGVSSRDQIQVIAVGLGDRINNVLYIFIAEEWEDSWYNLNSEV